MCPDGVTFVGRSGPNCEFEACPNTTNPVACQEDAKVCSDGTVLSRQVPNCEFPTCPSTPTKACTREYIPVCGQPAMPECAV